MDVVIFLKRRRKEFLVGNMNSRGLFERVGSVQILVGILIARYAPFHLESIFVSM